MERSELVQTLTLWFVVLLFVRTAPGTADSPLLDAVGIGAILLVYLLPVWIAVDSVSDFVASQ